MHKIAFCFLIYDIINCEDLWHIFFKNVDTNKYNIYIHYKNKTRLTYFEKYKLATTIKTKYEDQTIPLAYNLLFRTAFSDKDNTKFVILSGSCIPLKSFDYVYRELTKDSYGYFNVCDSAHCYPNCYSLLKVLDKKYISKSHNWFILNRKLVEQLCFDKDDFLNTYYNAIYAPAEYFYYTFIKILNLEDEIVTTLDVTDATTFTNWAGTDYKFSSDYRLKNYSTISEEELIYLLESKSLFGRKFNKECISSLYNPKYINSIQSI
jgi:hypothetical protein